MRKIALDATVIILMATLLITLNQFDLLEPSAKYMIVPFLAFYFIGQFVGRKFHRKTAD
jgi:hypothetical protein